MATATAAAAAAAIKEEYKYNFFILFFFSKSNYKCIHQKRNKGDKYTGSIQGPLTKKGKIKTKGNHPPPTIPTNPHPHPIQDKKISINELGLSGMYKYVINQKL